MVLGTVVAVGRGEGVGLGKRVTELQAMARVIKIARYLIDRVFMNLSNSPGDKSPAQGMEVG
jgi:hypothetical protein